MTTDQTEEVFSFTLQQRPSNIVTHPILGMRPYIILRPDLDGDDGETVISIEVGGGAELEGLGEVLEGIGQLLQEPDAAHQIDAAIQAAREKAEQDDEG